MSKRLELHDETTGGVCTIRGKGFLDANTFELLADLFEAVFRGGCYRLIFDLRNVDHVSSAGAGVMLFAFHAARANGGNLVFLSPTSSVTKVLESLGLLTEFQIFDDWEEARRSVEER
jgi:anti-anti-sigma factor